MEPNQTIENTPASAPTPVLDNNMMAAGGKKKSNGMLYGMILLAILAIGGIGFGVWAMMDGNSQKEQLNEQISALRKQNSELQEKVDNGGGSSSSETIIDVDGGIDDTVNTSDYIYVGEWGVKIKIPEELKEVNYLFQTHKWGKDEGGDEEIRVTGINKDVDRLPSFAVFFGENLGCMGLGRIMKSAKGNGNSVEPDETKEGWPSKLVFSDDASSYWYVREPLCSSSDEEKESERESRSVIEKMLINPDNYSRL